MTVLFGTVEYFEAEILNLISKAQTNNLSREDNLKLIYSELIKDLTNDFVCGDIFRRECSNNLAIAYEKIDKAMLVFD